MDEESIFGGFTRHRRFLIAVSLALLAYKTLGLESRKYSFFGNEFDVLHPDRVFWVGFVFWAWAAVTYVQWLLAQKGMAKLHDQYRARLQVVIARTIEPQPSDLGKEGELIKEAMETFASTGKGSPPLTVRREVVIAVPNSKPPHTLRINLNVIANAGAIEETSLGFSDYFYRDMPRGLLFWARVRSMIWTTFCTLYVSEYIVPMVIGLAPIYLLAAERWHFHWGMCVN